VPLAPRACQAFDAWHETLLRKKTAHPGGFFF
jgi:hypothetical protein